MNGAVNNQILLVKALPSLLTGITLNTFDCTRHLIINNCHYLSCNYSLPTQKMIEYNEEKMTVNKTLKFYMDSLVKNYINSAYNLNQRFLIWVKFTLLQIKVVFINSVLI